MKKIRLAAAMLAVAVILSAGCSRDPATRDYEKAEELLAKGAYGEALAAFAHILEKHQTSRYAPKSRYRTAFIYDNYLGDRKRAMDEYYALYHVFPQSPEAKLAREAIARIYSDGGNHAKALEEYLWLLKQRPTEPWRLKHKIALEYLRMGDLKQARIELTELLRSSQDTDMIPEVYIELANTYYIEGDTKKAVQSFDEVIDRFPKHRVAFEAKLNKANIIEEAGRDREALGMLRALAAEYPDKDEVRARTRLIEQRLREGAN